MLNYVGKNNNATVNTQAAIYENELFDLLAIKKLSIDKLLNDPKDYKALLREKKDADQNQRAFWAEMLKFIPPQYQSQITFILSSLFKTMDLSDKEKAQMEMLPETSWAV